MRIKGGGIHRTISPTDKGLLFRLVFHRALSRLQGVVAGASSDVSAFFVSCRPSRRKGHIMKIKYTFATGEATEVEVSEEIGAVIIASRKSEHAQDERHRCHCYSYDAIEYEGLEYASVETPENSVLSLEELRETNHRLYKGLKTLTETERRRLFLFSTGLSYREIAKREGVSSHSKIAKSIESARKKIKKFF